MFRWLLNLSKERNSTASLSNLCQCLVTVTVKRFSWCSEGITCISVVPAASGSVTGYHCKKPLSDLFSPFLHVFIHINKAFSETSLLLGDSPSSLSLSWYIRGSRPLILFWALHWTPSCMSMNVLYWTQHLVWPLQGRAEGKDLLLQPSAKYSYLRQTSF